jgi:DNA-binding NarL/FixJ family response regulator
MEAAVGGAIGYLLKGAPITDLLTSIDIIHEGGIWVDSYLPRYVFNTFLRHGRYGAKNLVKLTPQELKVLSLVAHGMGNDKIGTRLYISEKTVKNHLTHIFTKLRVSGRQQAVGRFLGGNKSTRRKQLLPSGRITPKAKAPRRKLVVIRD